MIAQDIPWQHLHYLLGNRVTLIFLYQPCQGHDFQWDFLLLGSNPQQMWNQKTAWDRIWIYSRQLNGNQLPLTKNGNTNTTQQIIEGDPAEIQWNHVKSTGWPSFSHHFPIIFPSFPPLKWPSIGENCPAVRLRPSNRTFSGLMDKISATSSAEVLKPDENGRPNMTPRDVCICYPPVIEHSYSKLPCLVGKSTINIYKRPLKIHYKYL